MLRQQKCSQLPLGLEKILPIQMLFGVWHKTEGLVGGCILRNGRALVMQ